MVRVRVNGFCIFRFLCYGVVAFIDVSTGLVFVEMKLCLSN